MKNDRTRMIIFIKSKLKKLDGQANSDVLKKLKNRILKMVDILTFLDFDIAMLKSLLILFLVAFKIIVIKFYSMAISIIRKYT